MYVWIDKFKSDRKIVTHEDVGRPLASTIDGKVPQARVLLMSKRHVFFDEVLCSLQIRITDILFLENVMKVLIC